MLAQGHTHSDVFVFSVIRSFDFNNFPTRFYYSFIYHLEQSYFHSWSRYLKRGVNEKGRVANDVETEQIVSQDTLEETPAEITSVVQNRGSIPLFWSQETSRLNIRPDIICKFQCIVASLLL